MSHHVAVWIDHQEAKIFQIEPESFEMTRVVSPRHHVTRKMAEQGTHTDASGFYHELAIALKGTSQLLLVGPRSAKLDFIRHLQNHDRALEATICGVETLDHPTDPQLVAYVRDYFKTKDRAR
jgi:stalled ribosome rescue protein Dom34